MRPLSSFLLMNSGGPDRDRTGDLLNAIQARSQLRYRPTFAGCRTLIVTRGAGEGLVRRARRRDWAVTGGCHVIVPGQTRQDAVYLCNGGRLAPMSKREPLGQLSGGLIRSRPVERHHGRRDAWRAQQLGAPTVADWHDLYEVGAPADSFFEAVNGQGPILNTAGGTGSILRLGGGRSSEAPREGGIHAVWDLKLSSRKKFYVAASQQLLHASSTPFPQPKCCKAFYRPTRGYNEAFGSVSVITRISVFALCCFVAPGIGVAAADDLLLRLFLTDVNSVVSYGEFARLDDSVVFSMVTGGDTEPRLHAVTLPASAIDWARTDQHAASTRYQRYVQTRAEEDFQRLSDGVAGVLSEVLSSTDRTRAIEVVRQALATLAEWPREHFGYRQQDVREILSFLDEVVSDLRAAAGMTSFDVALVAMAPDVVLEPLSTMPSRREQIDQVFRVASLAERPSERVALLQTALLLLDEAGATILPTDAATLRRFAETGIREEQAIDVKYLELARRLMRDATRGASRARVRDVQRVLIRIPREDARLGHRRPEMVHALRASVQTQLDAARRLRLLQDQWAIRRSLYREYQRSVGGQWLQFVKSQPALEAIRRLEGPTPDALRRLQATLRGGAEQLARIRPVGDLRTAHDLLVGAWRFAESAVNGRYEAARVASDATAWESSSAVAGALLLFSRAQQEIRELLEPQELR